MIDAEEPDKEITVNAPSGEMPQALAANFVHLSFSGPEAQLVLGYLDLHVIATAAEADDSTSIDSQIIGRYMLTARGIQMLKSQLDAMYPRFMAAQRAIANGAG